MIDKSKLLELDDMWRGYCLHHGVWFCPRLMGRKKDILDYRNIFVYYCNRDFGYSLTLLSYYFCRNHASFVSSNRRVYGLCVLNPSVCRLHRIYEDSFYYFRDYVYVPFDYSSYVKISPYVFPLLRDGLDKSGYVLDSCKFNYYISLYVSEGGDSE